MKAKKNLDRLVQDLHPSVKPVLLSGRQLTIASSFSGVCSQSRGASVLQSHGFGCAFKHICFCEKVQQCQLKLARDFPESCIFTNALSPVSADVQMELHKCSEIEDMKKVLEKANLASHVPCYRHGGLCSLPTNVDVSIFGAPCIHDSTMGKLAKDEGFSRKAAWKEYICTYSIFYIYICFIVT